MNVLAYKFHFPVKNLVVACGGEGLLKELEDGGYHVPVYGDELMDDYLHDAHEQSVWTNAWEMTYGDENATEADKEIADVHLQHQAEDIENGTTVSGDLNGDGVVDKEDAAITQGEWGGDYNSVNRFVEIDSGVQKDLVNSQAEEYDSHNYSDAMDSGERKHGGPVSGAEYYDGDAGQSKGLGVEGNNGHESTGATRSDWQAQVTEYQHDLYGDSAFVNAYTADAGTSATSAGNAKMTDAELAAKREAQATAYCGIEDTSNQSEQSISLGE